MTLNLELFGEPQESYADGQVVLYDWETVFEQGEALLGASISSNYFPSDDCWLNSGAPGWPKKTADSEMIADCCVAQRVGDHRPIAAILRAIIAVAG